LPLHVRVSLQNTVHQLRQYKILDAAERQRVLFILYRKF